jgi:hypothetical protein
MDLDVIYLEKRHKNASGIMTGIPPDKNTPMKIIRLK